MKPRLYITTAIDYVNSLPHLGTAYEKIGADALVRFLKMDGHEVHFQMGNDEHSINVKKEADRRQLDPKAYCDDMRGKFEDIWKSLNISYDTFIQTSEPRHHKAVTAFIEKIYGKNPGDIYLKSYEGWYCESCEVFLMEKDLVDGKCPTHKSLPKKLQERNYFFKLSAYREKLLEFYKANPNFILPESRRNEVVRFVETELQDISVSRTGFSWGIPFPEHPGHPDEKAKHVVYVWFDALVNYLTGLGFGEKSENFEKFWGNTLHVVGKDITRFHCVIWPAMLMSAGLEIPKTVFGHGFVYLKGEKMSKTLGNVVTPLDIVPQYGADALRHYLLSESSFGSDGDFTWDNFIKRYNSDLANDLGNLLNRTLGMANKYLGGKISKTNAPAASKKLQELVSTALSRIRTEMDYQKSQDIQFHKALSVIWEIIGAADKYIDTSAPWKLSKEGKTEEINAVLYHVLDTLKNIAILVSPFIPNAAQKVWGQLGIASKIKWEEQTFQNIQCNQLPDTQVTEGQPIFPRIELNPTTTEPKKSGDKKMETATAPAAAPTTTDNLIDISDFAKIDLRIAEIKQAEKVEGADRLLKLQLDVGGESRQIVSGIAQHYKPEDLIGKKIVIIANLKPAKIRGVESHGMLLAASGPDSLSVLTVDKAEVPTGSKAK